MPTRTETPTNTSEPGGRFRAGTQTRLVRLDQCLPTSPTESWDASVPSTAWLSPVRSQGSAGDVTLSAAAQVVGETVAVSGPVAAGTGQTDRSEQYRVPHGDPRFSHRHAVHPKDASAPHPVDLRRPFSAPLGAARHNEIGDDAPADGFHWSKLWPVGLIVTLILTIRWLTAPVLVTTQPQAAPRTIAIEDARLGLRAAGRNPLRGQVDVEALEPDPATWRALKVELVKPSGYRFWAELLRPQEWIDFLVDPQTNTIELDLPEFGAVGTARVLSIDPCPTIEPGKGNIITGLFRHEAEPGTAICRIEFSNGAVIEGVTANHPIYSLDRAEFIEAGQLRQGEYVQTTRGPARITRLASRAAQPGELLYNLETHREHVYQVTPDGVLVHNDCYFDTRVGQWRDRVTGRFTSAPSSQVTQTLTHRNGIFEVLSEQGISATTRSAHRTAANLGLLQQLEADAQLNRQLSEILGIPDVAAHMRSGRSALRNPLGTEWHHPIDNPNVMILLRREVHRHPDLQGILHPNRFGGYRLYYGGQQ